MTNCVTLSDNLRPCLSRTASTVSVYLPICGEATQTVISLCGSPHFSQEGLHKDSLAREVFVKNIRILPDRGVGYGNLAKVLLFDAKLFDFEQAFNPKLEIDAGSHVCCQATYVSRRLLRGSELIARAALAHGTTEIAGQVQVWREAGGQDAPVRFQAKQSGDRWRNLRSQVAVYDRQLQGGEGSNIGVARYGRARPPLRKMIGVAAMAITLKVKSDVLLNLGGQLCLPGGIGINLQFGLQVDCAIQQYRDRSCHDYRRWQNLHRKRRKRNVFRQLAVALDVNHHRAAHGQGSPNCDVPRPVEILQAGDNEHPGFRVKVDFQRHLNSYLSRNIAGN